MVNTPLPQDLAEECKKAAKILNSFIDPVAAKGPDKVIPPNVLQKAKGFAIFTVIKAGFLFSGRMGAGLVVARLEDGTWSAPSAIGTGGMGFGGQIGAEMTDFVIVLNSKDAVKTFTKGGNVTLGGNLSVAAGPVGRTAEGAGSLSLGHAAAIFSYSKSKGLFAGVSVEGSVIVERKDANAKFYNRKISAKELLSGQVTPPPQADVLYRALNAKASRKTIIDHQDNDSSNDDTIRSRSSRLSTNINNNHNHQNRFSQPPPYTPKITNNPFEKEEENYNDKKSSITSNTSNSQKTHSYHTASSKPPLAPKPNKPPMPPRKKLETAIAAYDFQGEQDDDLSFSKGDIIIIIKKTDSINDWWVGKCNGKEGNFPANYVEQK
ncbi:unnamed protein product [Rhizophagus irregularis]|uniref:DUF500-domain-containing protein n=1 Tax=Rhizophagus irregularis TaxID=588596 RepID=A0A2I1H1P7_9GLOM|nr:DUF500-domain-containing protein [Rhizophagus irregularis]CAB4411971.1 unnamed protein product [Rhizophagus irregularis]